MGASFNISEAAARAGVSADTIRYYERVGVLPEPPRTASGYRRYTVETVARIAFVRSAAAFGFPLKELAGFLRQRESGRPPCRSVKAAGERLLQEMDRQLAALNDARREMAEALADWDRRLAATPQGAPARLLESLPAHLKARPASVRTAAGSRRSRSGLPAAPTHPPSSVHPPRARDEAADPSASGGRRSRSPR
jgi:DNA-binding transcriptional MerR regulator